MIWIILVSFLLIVLAFLLFAPFQLKIDSRSRVFRVNWGSIITGLFMPDPNDFVQSKIQMRILFWQKEIKPFIRNSQSNEVIGSNDDKVNKPKRKRRKFPFKHPIRKIRALLNSFQIKVFDVNVDTDDYVMNAYLYPVFLLLSSRKRRLKINYEGKLDIRLWVKNSGARILYAFLKK